MEGPLGFPSRKCWFSGIADYLLMGGSPFLYWVILPLGWCLVILGMGPLGHISTLIFVFVYVIVCVRFFIPSLSRLIFPSWTYCFNGKPVFPAFIPMKLLRKEESYIVKK